MPTFMAFKGGEKIDELVGANPQALQVKTCAGLVHMKLMYP